MSWITCEHCGDLIDTDENPHTYREQKDMWVCDDCWMPPAREVEEQEEPVFLPGATTRPACLRYKKRP